MTAPGDPKHNVLDGYEGTLSFPPYTVQQDVWTRQGRQTMRVCSASHWTATVNEKGAPASGVKTYPDSNRSFTDWRHCSSQPRVSSFSKLSSSYTEKSPAAGSWNATWDVFLDGGVCGKPTTEVMVVNEWHNVDFPTTRLHPKIGGVAYDLTVGNHFLQFRKKHQSSSSTVNWLPIFSYLRSKRLVSPSATLQFVQAGIEVLTTGGKNLPFSLTHFSVTGVRHH
jgi:hypothetical protein